jgi:hypothetical protein
MPLACEVSGSKADAPLLDAQRIMPAPRRPFCRADRSCPLSRWRPCMLGPSCSSVRDVAIPTTPGAATAKPVVGRSVLVGGRRAAGPRARQCGARPCRSTADEKQRSKEALDLPFESDLPPAPKAANPVPILRPGELHAVPTRRCFRGRSQITGSRVSPTSHHSAPHHLQPSSPPAPSSPASTRWRASLGRGPTPSPTAPGSTIRESRCGWRVPCCAVEDWTGQV